MGLLGGPQSHSPQERGGQPAPCPGARRRKRSSTGAAGNSSLQPGAFESRGCSQCSKHPSSRTSSSPLLLDSTSGQPDAARRVAQCQRAQPQGSQGRTSPALPRQPRRAAPQPRGRSCPAEPGTAHHRWQTRNKNPGGWDLLALFRHSKQSPAQFPWPSQTVSPASQQPPPRALSHPALAAHASPRSPTAGVSGSGNRILPVPSTQSLFPGGNYF